MNSKRVYYAMVGLVLLLCVGLVGATYGANKLLIARSKTLTSQKAKSMALEEEKVGLQKAKKQVSQYADLEKIVKSVVPEDKDQAEAVREIVNIAAENNIKLAGFTFSASNLGLSATGTATTTAPSAAASSASNAKAKLSQLLPVKNIPGVYDFQIVVQSDPDQPVPYSKFIGFLSALEHNRRTAQVNTISLVPSKANRSLLTFTLTLDEYIKP